MNRERSYAVSDAEMALSIWAEQSSCKEAMGAYARAQLRLLIDIAQSLRAIADIDIPD